MGMGSGAYFTRLSLLLSLLIVKLILDEHSLSVENPLMTDLFFPISLDLLATSKVYKVSLRCFFYALMWAMMYLSQLCKKQFFISSVNFDSENLN